MLVTSIAIAIIMAGCTGKKEQKQPSMAKIACDESFEYIMEQEINVYEYIYPKEDVLAYYLPEKQAIDSIMAMGSVKGAVITRPLTDKSKQETGTPEKNSHRCTCPYRQSGKPGRDTLKKRYR